MKTNTFKMRTLTLALLSAIAAPVSVWAIPASDSPYVTDVQNSYVQDQTSDGINQLNMVLCIVNAMNPSSQVNQGPYVALVDMNKCDSKKSSASNSSSSSSGSSAAANYMTAVVDVTRTSNSDPMIGHVWMSMTEEGQQSDIYVHLTATQSPTDLPPYGQLRVDYLGKSGGQTQFNGFVDTNGGDVSYLETGQNSSQDAMKLSATDTTSGSGTMQMPDPNNNLNLVTFNFAYDSSETSFPNGIFRRYFTGDSSDVCFDRSKANAQKSVWGYGTYNADTGAKVDQANPSFPLLATDNNGTRYYGYAGYWGINFQGIDLNSVADGSISGYTFTDQRPNSSTTYNLFKSSGKLTKWTQNTATLDAMDGVPFSFYGDLTGLTDQSLTGFNNWQMQWNAGTHSFIVIGTQQCDQNGCTLADISPAANVNSNAFDTLQIMGWSNSFGGSIIIPSTGSAHAGTDSLNYYAQSTVVPGSANEPTALYCLSRCPTATSVAGFTGSNSPYGNNTDMQWGMADPGNTVSYTFGASGLQENSSSLVITDASKLIGQYQHGVQTGNLFTSDFVQTQNCPQGKVCEPNNPSVYYTWETGANQWNQSAWLTKTSDNSVVTFDPPANIAYTVPNDAASYGTWAGKNIQLQFNGFGNLNGIPGSCVSPADNSPVACNTPMARYVPAFALPDGATMTMGSTPLIVKALNAEIRLSKVANCTGVTLAQPTGGLILPLVSDVHDPSDPADANYLGIMPTVTSAPKVIDGVIQ